MSTKTSLTPEEAEFVRRLEAASVSTLAVMPPEARASFELRMEEVRSGRDLLRQIWQALTVPQRALVERMRGGAVLVEAADGRSYRLREQSPGGSGEGRPGGSGETRPGGSGAPVRWAMARALLARGVVCGTGPAERPDLRLELTRRGRALLALRRAIN